MGRKISIQLEIHRHNSNGQIFFQLWNNFAGHAVTGVNHHSKRLNFFYVNKSQNVIDILSPSIALLYHSFFFTTLCRQLFNRLKNCFSADHQRIGSYHFKPIVLFWVVRSGNHHPGLESESAGGKINQVNRHQPKVNYISPFIGDTGNQLLSQRWSRNTHIRTKCNLLYPNGTGKRPTNRVCRFFSELLRINTANVV